MEDLYVILFIVGLCAIIVAVVGLVRHESYKDGYMQGQIDCLNGKVKYEKILNKDCETVWTEIKKTK